MDETPIEEIAVDGSGGVCGDQVGGVLLVYVCIMYEGGS